MPPASKHPTAIVTGASRGIGRAIAIALGGAGFNVVINYRSNAAAAEECAAIVKNSGGGAATLLVQADVADLSQHQRLVDTVIERFGRIDVLVNNAGVAPAVRADLLDTTAESFDLVLGTDLRGPFFLTQLVARWMIAQARNHKPPVLQTIVNIGSVSAYAASVNRGEYCIAKAGLAMMTSLFAARLAEAGILVYEVRPGVITTDMTAPVKAKYDKMIGDQDLLPLPRWGKPEDVAQAVLAMATGQLPYSTGQVIDVDGGFHIRRL
jgi:3-oxoacyl-[acyl-carrier protein] reductase